MNGPKTEILLVSFAVALMGLKVSFGHVLLGWDSVDFIYKLYSLRPHPEEQVFILGKYKPHASSQAAWENQIISKIPSFLYVLSNIKKN